MKRIFSLVLCICLLLCVGCTPKENTLQGRTVLARDDNFNIRMQSFELSTEDGKYYDIRLDEATEFHWEVDIPQEFGGLSEYTVTVAYDPESAQPCDRCFDGSYYAKEVTVIEIDEIWATVAPEKPVIYLYPEVPTQVSVRLDYDGELTCTYPAYENGWSVTAYPDGTLSDGETEYNYLYWEGVQNTGFDFSQGFCVKGSDTAAFLEAALAKLGLTRTEANEFIVYWLPQMQNNEYNVISFQNEAYTDHARLDISPVPDTVLRVFMAWQASDSAVSIPEQELTAPERSGFTVVEWGGCEVR